MEDKQLQTVWQQRQIDDGIKPLAVPVAMLLKHQLGKKVRQLHELAEIWDELVPDQIAEHTALESLNQGVLTVMADTAAHRFQLESLLRGGLMRMLQQRLGSSLRRVKVIPGQFYSVDIEGRRRYELQ